MNCLQDATWHERCVDTWQGAELQYDADRSRAYELLPGLIEGLFVLFQPPRKPQDIAEVADNCTTYGFDLGVNDWTTTTDGVKTGAFEALRC